MTTPAYPRFAGDPPGLGVDGRKTWAPGKTLERFFNTRLGIPPRRYREMVEALCDSAVSTGKEVEAAKNEPRWSDWALGASRSCEKELSPFCTGLRFGLKTNDAR